MEYTEKTDDNSTINTSVYTALTLAVALSIALISSGIWKAQKTADIAQANIKTSLELQQLGNTLRSLQDGMSQAIEFAVSYNEPQWRVNYENSLLKLQQVTDSTRMPITNDLFTSMRKNSQSLIPIERELFRMIAEGDPASAFAILSSEEYQEQKLEQEQLALTLRATLDSKAKEVIEKLNHQLNQTTLALLLQIVLMIVIWGYVVTVLRKWQRSQNQHSSELARLAHYDSLTGIGNRALFQIRLKGAFTRAKQTGKSAGLLLMDIDHFKDINDSLGHDIGDQLLILVAEEVKRTCRETDTVVRLGGDEFAVIMTDLDEKRDSAMLSNKILSIFEAPINIRHHQIKTGTSIGLAFFPDDANSSEELLRKADMALYEAKRDGRANFKFFDHAIETTARNKLALQEDLDRALEENQFELHFQPIVSMAEEKIIGAECLLRWHHPDRGLVPPNEFIAVAEESRLIVPIGEWVLRTACLQLVRWQARGLPPLNLAVNLSGVQFNEANLLEKVKNILIDTGVERDKLTLEITESTLMETEGDVIGKLHALNNLGLKLAIDDFGTGYSSLAYLKRFPIHHLKIDREFVRELPHNTHDVAISRSIIKMAHELGIKVVAEGIENQAQFSFLNDGQCNYGQGYYFGKPVTASEFENWVDLATTPHSNVIALNK